ncbi:MAG TPA: hypothetical protein VFX45_05880 [Solirubrobacterales bacterium]|nr:hypothetical protein [Solirubrobacterales bacterium]
MAADPELLPRRLLRVAACLALLLILVVANYLLHSEENPFNPIAQAAGRTQQMPGARTRIEATYTSAGLPHPVVATGSGVYNARTNRTRMTLSVPSPQLGKMEVEAVGDDRTVYVRSPQISADLPPGRQWMAIKPWMGRTEATAIAGNGDTEGTLEMLGAVGGDVESLGRERLRGVSTERYRGSIDLHRYADRLAAAGEGAAARQYERLAEEMPEPVAVEAWIDDHDVIRMMRMTMTLPTSGETAAVTMDMRIEFSHFGVAPKVHLPSPAQTFDATPLARIELGLFDGHSVGPLSPKPGTPALTAAALRRRANTICARVLNRIEPLTRSSKPELETLERLSASGFDSASPEAVEKAFRDVAYAYFEPVLRRFMPSLHQLGRLAPPPELAPLYRRFLLATARGAELMEATSRAYEVASFGSISKLKVPTDRASAESDATARTLGIERCISSS